uniref:G8 domain-containing protein n=1 Tax=Dracunculus medinensis TaxID=318479 RepID=A0A0N4UPC8_DRAME
LISAIVVQLSTCTTSTIDNIHCTRISPMQGDITEMDGSGKKINMRNSLVAEITLKETVCLNFTSSRTPQLHTFEFVRMEQHFPVVASYKFGIPQIHTSCICDCAGAEQYCSVETHKYKNCSKGSVCYRTYHPFQSNTGCISSSRSEVCCEIIIEPAHNKVYTAVKLNQPDTIIILKYRFLERAANRWVEMLSEEFEAIINKGSAKIENIDGHKTEIRATSGRAIREMTEGLYYFWDEKRVLMSGVRLNDPAESNIHKLGWLRREEGIWVIRNGIIKITDSQHITIENCKSQRYLTRYNADYFLTDSNDISQMDLGFRVDELSWVERVLISSNTRSIRVLHAEGTVVHLTITTDKKPLIVQHTSQIRSFDGFLRMDDKSNRFLNLSLIDVKGTLIGYIHQSEEKTKTEWSFSVEVGSFLKHHFITTIGGIPPEINNDRYVCIHPAGDINAEKCKWLQYEADPLRQVRYTPRWQIGIGDCPGCNERGFDNFLQKLDPRQWLNGLDSTTEIVTCALEVTLAIATFLTTVLIFTKCVIPLARWVICLASPSKK